jgi:hypothetical protein
MKQFIMIDWAGPPLFGEQMMTVANIAELYLQKGTYGKKVNFTHLLLEGRLTLRGPTTYGTFAGIGFFADFGTYNDRPWYCHFLLPANRRIGVPIPEDMVAFAIIHEGDGCHIHQIEVEQARVTEDNILPKE